MTRAREPDFDPIAIFKVLERRHVSYVVIGALARVLHGTDELTDGIDIVPSMKEKNLLWLDGALEDLNARRQDGKRLDAGALAGEDVLELQTDHGELKIVPEPAGTRGYDDLRRATTGEHLGFGVRVRVASVGDLARMTAALGREEDERALRMLHRVAELERSLGLGLEL